MVDGALTSLQRRQNLVAVIAAMAVTSLIYGLSLPLLGLVMNAHGIDNLWIGLSAAVQSVGIIFLHLLSFRRHMSAYTHGLRPPHFLCGLWLLRTPKLELLFSGKADRF